MGELFVDVKVYTIITTLFINKVHLLTWQTNLHVKNGKNGFRVASLFLSPQQIIVYTYGMKKYTVL